MEIKDIENYIGNIFFSFQKVIGIYHFEDLVYVVQLKRSFKKISEIKRKKYFIKNDSSLNEILVQLKSDFNIKNTLFITNFIPNTALFKIIKIPILEKKEIYSWLYSNFNSIYKTPINLEKVYLFYKIIDQNENEIVLFLALINKTEIDNYFANFKTNGLTLYTLSLGLADYCLKNFLNNKIECFYILQEKVHEIILIKKDELIYYNQIPQVLHKNEKNREKLSSLYQKILRDDFDSLSIKDYKWIEFDYRSDTDGFDAASALAERVIKQKNKTFLILPERNKKLFEEFFWRQVTSKIAIFLGSIFIILFLFPFLTNIFIKKTGSNIEIKLEALKPKTQEVHKLKHIQNILEKDLAESKTVFSYRSNSNLILKIIAYYIPSGCWLTEINYKENSEDDYNVRLLGMTRTPNCVNIFLKKLESEKRLKHIKLDYINHLSIEKMFRKWKIKSDKFYEFHFSIKF